MSYLLDTNTVSALMAGIAAVAARVVSRSREEVAICQVTVAEIEFGLRLLPRSRRRRHLEERWAVIGAELIRVSWDDEVSRVFGEQKARLQRAGRRIDDFDLAIASHAIAYGMTLVSDDSAFRRLPVELESWLD